MISRMLWNKTERGSGSGHVSKLSFPGKPTAEEECWAPGSGPESYRQIPQERKPSLASSPKQCRGLHRRQVWVGDAFLQPPGPGWPGPAGCTYCPLSQAGTGSTFCSQLLVWINLQRGTQNLCLHLFFQRPASDSEGFLGGVPCLGTSAPKAFSWSHCLSPESARPGPRQALTGSGSPRPACLS